MIIALRRLLDNASPAVRRAAARAGALVTSQRATLAAAFLAAAGLAVSQFLAYRGIAVGAPDYAAYPGLEDVAPAPLLERDVAGSAHAWVLLPAALVALVALAAVAAAGRVRLGRVVAAIGLLAVAVTLAIDLPSGLEEGPAAVEYEGVRASLEHGFWVQLASGAVLAATGLLIARRGGGGR